LSTTPSPNYFEILSKDEEEHQLDTARSAQTHGMEPTHLVDPNPTTAIALSLDAKEKSPQSR
jgi:hypothetical protein